MLYSKNKERESKFFAALKISIPFLLLGLLWIYAITRVENLEFYEIILFIILSFFYVYYVFYIIYKGFIEAFTDPITGVYTRKKMRKILSSNIKKDNKLVFLIGIKNLNEISQRYGLENVDNIMQNFINLFEIFLKIHKYKKIPIGNYINGYFIFVVDESQEFIHNYKNFENQINNNGINNIEIFPVSSYVSTNDFNEISLMIANLAYQIQNDKINFNVNENAIRRAIEEENFILKLHKMKNLQNQNDAFYLSNKLQIKGHHFSKTAFKNLINQFGCEIFYDLHLIKAIISKNILENNNKIFIEISAVSLRNPYFQNEISALVKEGKLNPNNLVLEFYEDENYQKLSEFNSNLLSYKKLGFEISLSHFAGKNASLTYFLNLDIDYLVYDLDLLKKYYDKKYQILFKEFNKICSQNNIKSILRFVDNEEITKNLDLSNVDFIQGFLIQKPNKI